MSAYITNINEASYIQASVCTGTCVYFIMDETYKHISVVRIQAYH